jgi:hypothetical protein
VTLPRIFCREFKEAIRWEEIERVPLCDTVTGGVPRQETTFALARTQEKLHLRFRCIDDNPWATHRVHDAPLYEEEVVEAFLDPVGDLESYFEIEVNPLNAICDLVLRRNRSGYRKDFAWHCDGLATEVRNGDGVWDVEMVIPFRSIACEPPRAGDVWRGNFFRIDRPNRTGLELSAWAPTGFPKFHIQQRFGFIEFAAS